MQWTDRMQAAGRGGAVAIAVVAGACGGHTIPTSPSPPVPTYTLSGTVTEQTAEGRVSVAGAVVRHGVSGRTATTDDAGGYRITDMTASMTTITAEKDGYLAATRQLQIAGDTRLDLTMARRPPPLPSTYVITGIVFERVGSTSRPVDGVAVEEAYSRRSAITGADGRYRIELTAGELGRNDGFVQIRARKPGFADAVHERAVWEDTSIDLEIRQ